MIDALVMGRVVGKTASRTASNGNPFVTFRLRAPTTSGESLFVSVICFNDRILSALLLLEDGDSVSLSGELSFGEWTDKDGKVRPQLRLTAHAVLTPFHVTRRRKIMRESEAGTASLPFVDDELPPEGFWPVKSA